MASAFSNNTENLYSSDRTSNSKAKTNYNYLRLVSLKNVDNKPKYVGCNNKRFSSSSGNVILGLDDSVIHAQKLKNKPGEFFPPPSRSTEFTLSKLVNTRSYDLLNSINKGYYLPTTIPRNDTTNNNINRPPYTYDPSCKMFDEKTDTFITSYMIPNTSGDLQEILFNEYLDFGNLTLITNTQVLEEYEDNAPPFKTMNSNQLQVTDAAFTDYIIDPDNIISNYKDSGLPTYLKLQKEESNYNSDSKEKVLKVINWKKIQQNSFPNNKYYRFSFSEPIKFYNYNACLSNTPPPADFDKSDIRFKDDNDHYKWQSGKINGDVNTSALPSKGDIQDGKSDIIILG
tara:strand:+ start:1906 stop:2934 length:1029 start_codon:yes stop_codon:yes gene_type:complete